MTEDHPPRKVMELGPLGRVLISCLASGMLIVMAAGSASASNIPIGILSFDTLNPTAGGSPGINNFGIANFTGPTFGLPPDFPVTDPITLRFLQLTVSGSNGPQVLTLGDLGSGLYSPATLQFLDSVSFSNATIQGTLDRASFGLVDGTTFLADSSTVTATLSPSSGQFLSAGQDFAILSVSGHVAVVPEPSYGWSLPAILCIGLWVLHTNRYRNRDE